MEDKEKGLQGGNPEAPKENYPSVDNANPESTQGPINWQGDDRIVLHDQAAVAASIDESGELVIEQNDTLGNPEAMISIAPESVGLFARAISSLAGEIPTNSSAERARRYREKRKRDAETRFVTSSDERDANVTQRDANVTLLRVAKAST